MPARLQLIVRLGLLTAAAAAAVAVSAWRADSGPPPAPVPEAAAKPQASNPPVAAVETRAPVPSLTDLAAAAAELPRLRSLLVSRSGELLLERYFHGARADRPANIKSASKSVLAALVGVALGRGLLSDVTQPVAPFFKAEIGPAPDERKRTITVEHLLTMQTGLESTSGRNYGAWVQSPNWVRYVWRRPLVADPGTAMEYSTGNSHLLSALLTRVSGESTWRFAQDELARPLGFSLAPWPQDPQGIYFGGNDMLLTPRQMVSFGELYLNDGRIGERQLLPEGWVEQSCLPRGRSRWGSDREYGYGWWIRTLAGRTACYAWGYGGQFIFVVPDQDAVIVTTSDPNVSRERREHLQGIYDLAGHIIAALRAD